MKQTIKKIPFQSYLPLITVGVFALFFYSNSPSNLPPSSTPKPLSDSHQHLQSTTKVSTTKNKIDTYDASSKKSSTATVQNSPKQAKITKSVTKEYVYRIFGAVNDPLASSDWTLITNNASAAWDTATGGTTQTIVAVIDTGFALAHEDLESQWAQNTNETGMTQSGDACWTGTPENKSSNNCDDDDNGYVDDWRGWNFVHSDNNPQTGRDNPTGIGTAHGTEVAGFVGATGNNNLGTTAINQNTKIMPLAALDDDGLGYTSHITAAIRYAADNNADVINLSLGTYANDLTVKSAVNYAISRDVVVVAAAGNCGTGSDIDCPPTVGSIGYPAAYPNVIAVGATTQSGTRASFSSYGKELDITAPGYNLPVATSWSQANPTARYVSGLSGTSFSAPQVASLVALIKSIRPSTSTADIVAIIDGTASKTTGMNGSFYTEKFGHGVIDAAEALTVASALNASSHMPTLLASSTAKIEHVLTSSTSTISSGCTAVIGDACTVQFTDPNGYTRYLPYSILTSPGTGWTWTNASLATTYWEIRARSGENLTDSPYILIKKS